jgi:hypothetical protein
MMIQVYGRTNDTQNLVKLIDSYDSNNMIIKAALAHHYGIGHLLQGYDQPYMYSSPAFTNSISRIL